MYYQTRRRCAVGVALEAILWMSRLVSLLFGHPCGFLRLFVRRLWDSGGLCAKELGIGCVADGSRIAQRLIAGYGTRTPIKSVKRTAETVGSQTVGSRGVHQPPCGLDLFAALPPALNCWAIEIVC